MANFVAMDMNLTATGEVTSWQGGEGKPRMRLTWAHNKMHKENKFSSSMPMQMAAARRLQSIYSGKLK